MAWTLLRMEKKDKEEAEARGNTDIDLERGIEADSLEIPRSDAGAGEESQTTIGAQEQNIDDNAGGEAEADAGARAAVREGTDGDEGRASQVGQQSAEDNDEWSDLTAQEEAEWRDLKKRLQQEEGVTVVVGPGPESHPE